jgi:hypothetical protein
VLVTEKFEPNTHHVPRTIVRYVYVYVWRYVCWTRWPRLLRSSGSGITGSDSIRAMNYCPRLSLLSRVCRYLVIMWFVIQGVRGLLSWHPLELDNLVCLILRTGWKVWNLYSVFCFRTLMDNTFQIIFVYGRVDYVQSQVSNEFSTP